MIYKCLQKAALITYQVVQAFYAFIYCLENVKLNIMRDTFNGIAKFSKIDTGFDNLFSYESQTKLILSLVTSAGNLFKFCCRASTEYQVAVSD